MTTPFAVFGFRQTAALGTPRKMQPTPARPIEAPIADYPGALDYAAVEDFLRLLNPTDEVDRVAQLAASMALNAKVALRRTPKSGHAVAKLSYGGGVREIDRRSWMSDQG